MGRDRPVLRLQLLRMSFTSDQSERSTVIGSEMGKLQTNAANQEKHKHLLARVIGKRPASLATTSLGKPITAHKLENAEMIFAHYECVFISTKE